MQNLKMALINLQEKLGYFEHELSITASPTEKFELQKRIQKCEQEITRIQSKINSFQDDNESQVIAGNAQPQLNYKDQLIANNQKVSMKQVFICHVREDKQQVVEPLVNALEEAKISYWYDKAEIKWGDSITKKVNEGLRKSRFVIVVLSSTFIKKQWVQRELYSVLNIEASTGEVKILLLVVGANSQKQQDILKALPLGHLEKLSNTNSLNERYALDKCRLRFSQIYS